MLTTFNKPFSSLLFNRYKFILPLVFSGIFIISAITAHAQNSPAVNNNAAGLRDVVTRFIRQQAGFKSVSQASLSPDGDYIVWVGNGSGKTRGIYLAAVAHPERVVQIKTANNNNPHNENSPRWSPDGHRVAFLSDYIKKGLLQVYITNIKDLTFTPPVQVTKYSGFVSDLQWAPDGRYISNLYVDNASRIPSPAAATGKFVGVIDSLGNHDIQRVAVTDLAKNETTQVTPVGLYIFEYGWSPDSKSLTYTAALPPGDDNWYIAKLYTQNLGTAEGTIIYEPSKQIALPRWSPDGKRIAFIEGLMSDQGITGGELFTIASLGKETPKNHTPGRKSTPAWFTWRPDNSILFTEHVSGYTAINTLNTNSNQVKKLWQTEQSVRTGAEGLSISIAGTATSPKVALIRSSWNTLPEIWTGSPDHQTQFTRVNAGISLPVSRVESVAWVNEGLNVQGWLLYPAGYDSTRRYPLLVDVHGGPAGVGKPSFGSTIYAQLGYFVFFPNPRGSFGQGETFTEGNRRDWGLGDLRDILAGVDVVLKKVSVDPDRLGLFGWSYGGSMAMFAVTQTNRFKAVVAGAGAADWSSYYGQNSIDQWMKPYFGASPYDDPAAYAKVSAMTYIKNVKTPTLVLAGEYDGESPSAQAIQFWHALKELKVPTQLVIYPNEGHGFNTEEDRIDVLYRHLDWFATYIR
jgi:dipeptidyl aminopeptidase/acylaminoacyl peptidase